MRWSFEKLLNHKNDSFKDEDDLNLKDDLIERYPETILDASPFHVSVEAIPDNGDVHINSTVKGEVTVPSSRSLEPVKLPMDFSVHETYVISQAAFDRYDNEDVVIRLSDDQIIDFDKAVSDNVIVNIPMHVLSPEEESGEKMPKGNDWEVVSEDDFISPEKGKMIDPRLEALKNFKPSEDDK